MRRHSSYGFTLTELLVAVAILAVVFTSIVAIFVASVRAMKTSFVAMDANELARTSFTTVEKDLKTLYASRDFGQYYQFHGTPVGFSGIGLIRNTRASADTYSQLGRVTYALFPNPQPNAGTEGDFSGFDGYYSYNVDATGTPLNVTTMSLVRFVEPGITSLDHYPPEFWETLMTDPEFGTGVAAVLSTACNCDPLNPVQVASLTPERETLLNAAKRSLWVNLMAWQFEPGVIDPDLQSLNVWDGLLRPTFTLNPADYVITESIRTPNLLDPAYNPLDTNQAFFSYGVQYEGNTLGQGLEMRPFWPHWARLDSWSTLANLSNAQNMFAVHSIYYGNLSPFAPRVPEMVMVRFPMTFASPYPGAPEYSRELEIMVDVPVGQMRNPQ
ncbi:MAG: hypothetical protein AMXMBFR84_02320 [Candidatus Hydrogenedentota bacterium]